MMMPRCGGALVVARCLTTAVALAPRTLITFDVDSTLVKGSSAQAEASAHAKSFGIAVGRVFGDGSPTALPAAVLPAAEYHGSTDGLIALRLARAACGVGPEASGPRLGEVFEAMYDAVKDLEDDAFAVGIEPLPGVTDALRALAADDRVVCGLVTGNVEAIARKKMRATGIFALGALAPPDDAQVAPGAGPLAAAEADAAFLGGFGSDFCSCDLEDADRNFLDRGEQIAIAWRRAKRRHPSLSRLVHVGDAPADVLAAKACALGGVVHGDGAPAVVACIGVGTGKYAPEDLADLAGAAVPGAWEPAVLPDGLNDAAFLDVARG